MKKQSVPKPEDPRTLLCKAFARSGVRASCMRPKLCLEAKFPSAPPPLLWAHFEYDFLFRRQGRSIGQTWSVGANEDEVKRRKPDADKYPAPAEVLGRCCEEAREAYGATYPTWAAAFGYTLDSIRAREVYDRCVRLYSDLCWILTPAQISELADLASTL